jgi:hypothetical protein
MRWYSMKDREEILKRLRSSQAPETDFDFTTYDHVGRIIIDCENFTETDIAAISAALQANEWIQRVTLRNCNDAIFYKKFAEAIYNHNNSKNIKIERLILANSVADRQAFEHLVWLLRNDESLRLIGLPEIYYERDLIPTLFQQRLDNIDTLVINTPLSMDVLEELTAFINNKCPRVSRLFLNFDFDDKDIEQVYMYNNQNIVNRILDLFKVFAIHSQLLSVQIEFPRTICNEFIKSMYHGKIAQELRKLMHSDKCQQFIPEIDDDNNVFRIIRTSTKISDEGSMLYESKNYEDINVFCEEVFNIFLEKLKEKISTLPDVDEDDQLAIEKKLTSLLEHNKQNKTPAQNIREILEKKLDKLSLFERENILHTFKMLSYDNDLLTALYNYLEDPQSRKQQKFADMLLSTISLQVPDQLRSGLLYRGNHGNHGNH